MIKAKPKLGDLSTGNTNPGSCIRHNVNGCVPSLLRIQSGFFLPWGGKDLRKGLILLQYYLYIEKAGQ